MYQRLIEALNERAKEITKRKEHLEQFIREYETLEDEQKHIIALLEAYNGLSISGPPAAFPQAHESIQQEDTPGENSTTSHALAQAQTRYSPGETEKNVDAILSRGEKHSIISLTRRIEAVLNIRHSDSTVGVVLKRGEKAGKYMREANQWSMVIGQKDISNDNTHPFLITTKGGGSSEDD